MNREIEGDYDGSLQRLKHGRWGQTDRNDTFRDRHGRLARWTGFQVRTALRCEVMHKALDGEPCPVVRMIRNDSPPTRYVVIP